MQVIGRATKKKSGLRFWNRALGIKVNVSTPHTWQPLTGVTLWGLVVGMALVLMGQVAFADTGHDMLPDPTCSGLPAMSHLDDDEVEISGSSVGSGDALTEKDTTAGTADEGDEGFD